MVDEAYGVAKRILEENMDILHKGASLLMEKEKITGAEFEELFQST